MNYLDHFLCCPTEITEWEKTTNDKRTQNYSLGVIRDILDKDDGLVNIEKFGCFGVSWSGGIKIG